MAHVNAYLVVRKQKSARYANGLRILKDNPIEMKGKFYSGIERMPFFDLKMLVEENGGADNSATELISELISSPIDSVLISEASANSALALSQQRNIDNEIIAIRSPLLTRHIGESVTLSEIRWLGFDCIQLDGWSLLVSGLYCVQDFFGVWKDRINQEGLLNSREDVAEYADFYKQIAMREDSGVEPLPFDDLPIDAVQVGVLTVN